MKRRRMCIALRRMPMRWQWPEQLEHGTLGDGLDGHRAAAVQQDAGEISQGNGRDGEADAMRGIDIQSAASAVFGNGSKSWGHEMIRSALRRARAHSHAVISKGDGRGIDIDGPERALNCVDRNGRGTELHSTVTAQPRSGQRRPARPGRREELQGEVK